jgi:alpha-glucoside transport system substrate-binding protein
MLLAAAACGGGSGRGEVTVMVPWSGDEFQAFYSVVKTFEDRTGIRVDVEITRAQTQQLDAAVAAGAPPDVAMLPSVGAIDRYVPGDGASGASGASGADTAATAGRLRPLGSAVTKDYVQPFRGLGTVRGTVYAIPVKADVKSLVWYDPAVTAKPPASAATSMPPSGRPQGTWCLGLASGPTSGWPGADWIADILLATNGKDEYEKWVSGGLEWSASKDVRDAWQTWRGLVGTKAVQGAAVKPFAEAAGGMFGSPPSCALAHGALSAMALPPDARPQQTYAFVAPAPSPDRPLQVSADFVGRFTDNPAATKLITYLSSADAQRAWVRAAKSAAISADSQVRPGDYRNPVQREIARMLQPRSGWTLCFSAADAMAPDMSAAFYRAVLDYAYAGDAQSLGKLLRNLDAVKDAPPQGQSPVPAGSLCAAPG